MKKLVLRLFLAGMLAQVSFVDVSVAATAAAKNPKEQMASALDAFKELAYSATSGYTEQLKTDLEAVKAISTAFNATGGVLDSIAGTANAKAGSKPDTGSKAVSGFVSVFKGVTKFMTGSIDAGLKLALGQVYRDELQKIEKANLNEAGLAKAKAILDKTFTEVLADNQAIMPYAVALKSKDATFKDKAAYYANPWILWHDGNKPLAIAVTTGYAVVVVGTVALLVKLLKSKKKAKPVAEKKDQEAKK